MSHTFPYLYKKQSLKVLRIIMIDHWGHIFMHDNFYLTSLFIKKKLHVGKEDFLCLVLFLVVGVGDGGQEH